MFLLWPPPQKININNKYVYYIEKSYVFDLVNKYALFVKPIYPKLYFYTTLTNFSMEYHLMCKVYTGVGGIK